MCAEREPVDYRVTGLDLSPRSLQFAREAAASEGLLVEWVQADMRDIPADTLFDAIVNWAPSSIGILSPRPPPRTASCSATPAGVAHPGPPNTRCPWPSPGLPLLIAIFFPLRYGPGAASVADQTGDTQVFMGLGNSVLKVAEF